MINIFFSVSLASWSLLNELWKMILVLAFQNYPLLGESMLLQAPAEKMHFRRATIGSGFARLAGAGLTSNWVCFSLAARPSWVLQESTFMGNL